MSLAQDMRQTLINLGIDASTFEWQQLSLCGSLDKEYITAEDDIFYDKYERDSNQAKQTDQMCLHCPVAAECFEYGQSTKLTGVFGGFYMTKGEVDASRNKHKTKEIVKQLSERIYDV